RPRLRRHGPAGPAAGAGPDGMAHAVAVVAAAPGDACAARSGVRRAARADRRRPGDPRHRPGLAVAVAPALGSAAGRLLGPAPGGQLPLSAGDVADRVDRDLAPALVVRPQVNA